MRRFLLIPLMIVLVVGLVFSGCAAPAPAPAPVAPGPGPTPSPVPGPTPALKPAEHETVNLEIYSLSIGGLGYVVSFALADFINKQSEWLRATALETRGSSENVATLAKHPEKEPIWVGFANPFTLHQAAVGAPPFEEPYPAGEVKGLARILGAGTVLWTLDPNIKTYDDLIGKRIGGGTLSDPQGYLLPPLFEYALGIPEDKVSFVYIGGFAAVKDALIDGSIHACHLSFLMKGDPALGNWIPSPPASELMTMKECYFLSYPEEGLLKASKESGQPIAPVSGKGGTFGKTTVPDWTGWAGGGGWFVHKNMDDEVVTELLRIIWDNADKFAEYHKMAELMTMESFPGLPIAESDYHPAATVFYKIKGVKKVGM